MNIDPMDARFMTEAEIAKEFGMPTAEFKTALPKLIEEGFPAPDIRFFNRRYWPRVKLFMDWRYGLADDNTLDVNRSVRLAVKDRGKVW